MTRQDKRLDKQPRRASRPAARDPAPPPSAVSKRVAGGDKAGNPGLPRRMHGEQAPVVDDRKKSH